MREREREGEGVEGKSGGRGMREREREGEEGERGKHTAPRVAPMFQMYPPRTP